MVYSLVKCNDLGNLLIHDFKISFEKIENTSNEKEMNDTILTTLLMQLSNYNVPRTSKKTFNNLLRNLSSVKDIFACKYTHVISPEMFIISYLMSKINVKYYSSVIASHIPSFISFDVTLQKFLHAYDQKISKKRKLKHQEQTGAETGVFGGQSSSDQDVMDIDSFLDTF